MLLILSFAGEGFALSGRNGLGGKCKSLKLRLFIIEIKKIDKPVYYSEIAIKKKVYYSEIF